MHCHISVNKPKIQELSKLNKGYEHPQKKLKLLECKISLAKKSLKQYLKLEKECLANNAKKINDIEKDEFESFKQINLLLRKFERLKITVINLNSNFNEKSNLANIISDSDQFSAELKVDKIKSQISEIEYHIASATEEKIFYQKYLEQEYISKNHQIKELKNELEKISNHQEHFLYSLKSFLEDQINSIIGQKTQIIRDNTDKITEKYLETDKDIRNVFIENQMMKKLTTSYMDLYKALDSEVILMKNKLAISKLNKKSTVLMKKCLPDTNIELNVEKITDLPI